MKKYKVTLTVDERQHLRGLIAAGKAAAQKWAHARTLLKADAAPDGPSWIDDRISDAVEVSTDTVARVRSGSSRPAWTPPWTARRRPARPSR